LGSPPALFTSKPTSPFPSPPPTFPPVFLRLLLLPLFLVKPVVVRTLSFDSIPLLLPLFFSLHCPAFSYFFRRLLTLYLPLPVLMLVILFLAVTSAASAELVACGSMLTCAFSSSTLIPFEASLTLLSMSPSLPHLLDDVYVPWINPAANNDQLLRADHIAVAGWGLLMGILGTIFHEIGISMGWLYEFMGCLLGGAVAPVALGASFLHFLLLLLLLLFAFHLFAFHLLSSSFPFRSRSVPPY
jgi:hypothetical protein